MLTLDRPKSLQTVHDAGNSHKRHHKDYYLHITEPHADPPAPKKKKKPKLKQQFKETMKCYILIY